MIEVKTKNGVPLFISLCDDVEPNKGGYYCEVYLDDDCIEDFDNFVIHKEDLDCFENEDNGINVLCEEYAMGVDDMPILNKKFNKLYDSVKDSYDLVGEFFSNYIFFNKRCNPEHREEMRDLFDKMGEVIELAHNIAEHYTWDKE